jgi:hypothetical protein
MSFILSHIAASSPEGAVVGKVLATAEFATAANKVQANQ